MHQVNLKIGLFVFLSLFVSLPVFSQSAKEKVLIARSEEAIEHFQKTDPEINKFFTGAYAYVVFPGVGKGGIGIGGAHGNGIIYKTQEPYGKATLTQASIGFQLGGQSFMEVIFLEDKRAFDNFIEGKVKLGAHASAVAATEGASVSANYNDGVSIFTATKGGLMYEATVGGQKFKYKPFTK